MKEDKIINDNEGEALSKEEILSRSRRENANKVDEREKTIIKQGVAVATAVGLALLFVVFLVNAVVLEKYSYELLGTVFVMSAINLIWQSRVWRRRKIILLCGIVQGLCGIALLVMWIVTVAA